MNDARASALDGRIRGAGALVTLGLVIEAVTLVWSGPVSFMVFMMVGAALVVLGIVYYLISLLTV